MNGINMLKNTMLCRIYCSLAEGFSTRLRVEFYNAPNSERREDRGLGEIKEEE